jgi:flagellar biosynthesis/type III secretory pathway M-ring protein FliF/YscJ
MISQIEMWTNKLSKKTKIALVIILLTIVFVNAMTAGESIGSALYYLTH